MAQTHPARCLPRQKPRDPGGSHSEGNRPTACCPHGTARRIADEHQSRLHTRNKAFGWPGPLGCKNAPLSGAVLLIQARGIPLEPNLCQTFCAPPQCRGRCLGWRPQKFRLPRRILRPREPQWAIGHRGLGGGCCRSGVARICLRCTQWVPLPPKTIPPCPPRRSSIRPRCLEGPRRPMWLPVPPKTPWPLRTPVRFSPQSEWP